MVNPGKLALYYFVNNLAKNIEIRLKIAYGTPPYALNIKFIN